MTLRALGLLLVIGSLVVAGCDSSAADTSSSTSPATSTLGETTTTATAATPAGSAAPADGEQLLLVVGDWGSGDDAQSAVAAAMEQYSAEHEVTAILTTGDNFYSDDAEFLMEPFDWVADATIDWWVTWGNHDVESEARIEAVDETFGDPPRWTVIEWGLTDVVILDSNQVTSLPQAAFFLSAMAANDRPMIVSLHHPPYSCSHHGSTTEIVNQWVEVLDDDVILVLSGHDHSYQRFEERGVAYVVTGGGGRGLRPLSECPKNHPTRIAGAELHHFVALEQTEEELVVSAIDVNGGVFDQLTIELP